MHARQALGLLANPILLVPAVQALVEYEAAHNVTRGDLGGYLQRACTLLSVRSGLKQSSIE